MSPTTADFWEMRYQSGTTHWDLGIAAPAFVDLLASPQALPPGQTAVLGCGRGHDALLFAQKGFEVLGFDFAPSAIAEAQSNAAQLGSTAQFQQRDIFTLGDTFAQDFDYVVEHTCFCAIDPSQRSTYVQLVHTLLKPSGWLIGIFFTHDRPGGPPFGIAPAEVQQQFSPLFEIHTLQPIQNSVASRQGEEHLGLFQAR